MNEKDHCPRKNKFGDEQLDFINDIGFNVHFSENVLQQTDEVLIQTVKDIDRELSKVEDFMNSRTIDFDIPDNFMIKNYEGAQNFKVSNYNHDTRAIELDVLNADTVERLRRLRHELGHYIFDEAFNGLQYSESYIREIGAEFSSYKVFGQTYKESAINKLNNMYKARSDIANSIFDSNTLKTHYYLAKYYGAETAINAFENAMTVSQFVQFDPTRLSEIQKIKELVGV